VNWTDKLGLRIEWNGMVINNELVRSNLERLNQAILDSDPCITDDQFVIRVTGGDRYRDRMGRIRSVTSGMLVPDSSQTSPHLIERGARAVDVQFTGITDSQFDNALASSDFLPANTIRGYTDGHTHIALPNRREFYTENPYW